ncbi:AraC family transcriptional regulator [Ruficoccus sp. ZRK36]|uniref:AraC family transcriptional regulator n=1 Tax=Ruficoccus sp. ZRK36 TaxID=2866311 RepID=UPI001C72A6A5|nr:AraC family transcriptional regulator [Ruficoccus sp. ZRK36]QYY36650.1 AraC family transcriptional regulator [Ruficoccus sp. ZRK36]
MNTLPPQTAENLLARVLRAPLVVSRATRGVFSSGLGAEDEIVTTCRLILILRGSMRYTIEGRTFIAEAGDELFVPAWTRRMWATPLQGDCEIAWCEFDDDPRELAPVQGYRRRPNKAAFTRDKRTLADMAALWAQAQAPQSALIKLKLEAELKSLLARFWPEAEPTLQGDDFQALPSPHPEVQRALRWLEAHAYEADALARLEAACELTPNYFRLQFRQAMHCTPGEYVQRLRLRRARQLIRATDWQLKRIAAEVGYPDPLYFSRLYRRFWGHSPSAERPAAGRSSE